jgi:4-hydroxybenzoate polyprenyltransferase
MRNKATALALSSHPGPGLAVTVIAIVLGIGLGLEPVRLLFLGLAVLANQVSVGLSNDWIDAERDRAVGRRDKPVAQGWIGAGAVRTAAWIAAGLAILLTVPLGWAATIVHAVFIASAWSYNAGLKKTPFSALPYIVSFGLLPAIVTLSRADPAWAAPWALGVGALLGIAAHFANVLPDLEDDRATGVRGLPHRLGRRAVSTLCYVVLLLAALLEFLGSGALGSGALGSGALGSGALSSLLCAIGLALNVGIAVAGIAIAARPTRWHFRLIILAAVIDVVVLAFAGERLLWA